LSPKLVNIHILWVEWSSQKSVRSKDNTNKHNNLMNTIAKKSSITSSTWILFISRDMSLQFQKNVTAWSLYSLMQCFKTKWPSSFTPYDFSSFLLPSLRPITCQHRWTIMYWTLFSTYMDFMSSQPHWVSAHHLYFHKCCQFLFISGRFEISWISCRLSTKFGISELNIIIVESW
jgi:hypothetical protein